MDCDTKERACVILLVVVCIATSGVIAFYVYLFFYTRKKCERLTEADLNLDCQNKKLEDERTEKELIELKLREETKAKEDALTRLSEQIALKLADNNPNIADLSDINRPTNLVEKFSQLYDNEWTDAFDALQQMPEFKEESEAIKKLLELLMGCYQFCRDQAAEQIQSMLKIENTSIPLENVPTELRKLLKDTRKKCAALYVLILTQISAEKLSDDDRHLLQDDKVRAYLKRCVELCWLMSVQDPPMALSVDVGTDYLYKKTKFREYTKSGPFIDYIVWPAVLIQDDGNLMAKGIAQCSNKITMIKETKT